MAASISKVTFANGGRPTNSDPSPVRPPPSSFGAPLKSSLVSHHKSPNPKSPTEEAPQPMDTCDGDKIQFDKVTLRQRLTPMQYSVTQEGDTERAFVNQFYRHTAPGTYACVVCSTPLFSSDTKYHSGAGWPAFSEVMDEDKVLLKKDTSGVGANFLLALVNPELIRTAVNCSKCGGHLGHLFHDGPKPSGKRYCINSSALSFTPSERPRESPGTKPVTPFTPRGNDSLDGKGNVCIRNGGVIDSSGPTFNKNHSVFRNRGIFDAATKNRRLERIEKDLLDIEKSSAFAKRASPRNVRSLRSAFEGPAPAAEPLPSPSQSRPPRRVWAPAEEEEENA